MEGEHTPTIIQLIRSTDLAIIQLKDSHLYSSIPTILTTSEEYDGVVYVNKAQRRKEGHTRFTWKYLIGKKYGEELHYNPKITKITRIVRMCVDWN